MKHKATYHAVGNKRERRLRVALKNFAKFRPQEDWDFLMLKAGKKSKIPEKEWLVNADCHASTYQAHLVYTRSATKIEIEWVGLRGTSKHLGHFNLRIGRKSVNIKNDFNFLKMIRLKLACWPQC